MSYMPGLEDIPGLEEELHTATTRDTAHKLAKSIVHAKQFGGNHYASMKIQPWDAMREWLSSEEYIGYQKGVIIAYLAREKRKGGLEDLRKAFHHFEELMSYLNERA